uniref:C2 domain-containing protein n=1 Tax=Rodentolepis nana TaxID=102285 RepID=A0A0R3THQ9_RODNA
LDVELFYENKEGVLTNGKSCDAWPFNPLCDIYFEICVTDEDGVLRDSSCNLHSEKTSPVRNTAAISYKFKVSYFENKLLKIRIKALDHDRFTEADELGKFIFQVHPYDVSSVLPTPLAADSTSIAHRSTKISRSLEHSIYKLGSSIGLAQYLRAIVVGVGTKWTGYSMVEVVIFPQSNRVETFYIGGKDNCPCGGHK